MIGEHPAPKRRIAGKRSSLQTVLMLGLLLKESLGFEMVLCDLCWILRGRGMRQQPTSQEYECLECYLERRWRCGRYSVQFWQLELNGRKNGTDNDRYRSEISSMYKMHTIYPTGDAAAVYSQ